MPSLVLRSVTVGMILAMVASAFIGPAASPEGNAYCTTVKVTCGAVAIAGSMYLTRAISMTLLQSGCTTAFQAAYVAAAAISGPGLAEILSVVRPANIGYVLAMYCMISVASGALWLRFYGRTA